MKMEFNKIKREIDKTQSLSLWQKGTQKSVPKETKKMEIPSSTASGFEKVKVAEEWHEATLREIKDISPGTWKGETFDRVAAIFDIEVNGEIKQLSKVCKRFISPRSTLGLIVVALGGEIGEKMTDVDSLYGKKCRILVENYTDSEGDVRSGIDKVKPLVE